MSNTIARSVLLQVIIFNKVDLRHLKCKTNAVLNESESSNYLVIWNEYDISIAHNELNAILVNHI